MKKIFFVIVSALTCTFLISCSSDDPVIKREHAIAKLYEKQNTVKIAVANSYEKNISSEWNAALLAKEVIEENGILDKKIELIKVDDGADAIKGQKAAYQIASDNEICTVIGHGYSDISIPASIIYQYYGIFMFNTSSTAPKLTMSNNSLLVRNISNDNFFGKAAAELCAEQGYSRVIIYYLNKAASNSLANSFEFNAIGKKITIVTRDSYELTTPDEDFPEVFEKWKSNFLFDAVLLAGTNPILGTIVSQMRSNGIDCPIIGAESFEDKVFTDTLSSKDDGKIFAVSNFDIHSEEPAFKDFYKQYVEKYETDPDYEAVNIYDALMVIAKSIKQAESADPKKFVPIIRQTYWCEAAGPYTIDASGDVKNRKVYKKVFKNGEFVVKDKDNK